MDNSKCNKCESSVDTQLNYCPHCGAPLQTDGKRKWTPGEKLVYQIIGVGVVGGVIGFIVDSYYGEKAMYYTVVIYLVCVVITENFFKRILPFIKNRKLSKE